MSVKFVRMNGKLSNPKVDIAAATTTTLGTPSTGKRLHVLGLLLVPAASMTVQPVFGSTAQTGVMTIAAPLWLPPSVVNTVGGSSVIPLWTGGVDEAFKLITAAATQLSGYVLLMEDDPS